VTLYGITCATRKIVDEMNTKSAKYDICRSYLLESFLGCLRNEDLRPDLRTERSLSLLAIS